MILVIQEIEQRRSIRKYMDKEIEKEKLLQVLEAARLAPSGNNTQPWNYIIVKSKEIKGKIVIASHNQKWMLTAPVFIVCVADIQCRIKGTIAIDEASPEDEVKRIIRDTAISVSYMLLQATSLQIGSCWVAEFEQKDIRSILNIPTDKYVLGVITLGYSAENPKPRPRKPLDEMIRNEVW